MTPKTERAIVGFITLSGLLALFSKLSLLKNPTLEGVRSRSRSLRKRKR